MSSQHTAKTEFASEKPSRWVVRFRAVQRLALWHFYSGRLPLYLITEFPKSGGTWLAKMLSECLEVPFPDPHSAPRLESCIMRGTALYSRRFHNVVAMMRDGRDIMVSAYHHFLFPNEHNLQFSIDRNRRHLQFQDYDDLRGNLPRFIEFMFTKFPRLGWSTRFTWSGFVDSWLDRGAPLVKYEDLLDIPHETLRNLTLCLSGRELGDDRLNEIVDKYSFRKMTGRSPGQEQKNSFARKGIAGDWKNNFSPEAREIFHHYAGDHLIKLGYETSSDWVWQESAHAA